MAFKLNPISKGFVLKMMSRLEREDTVNEVSQALVVNVNFIVTRRQCR